MRSLKCMANPEAPDENNALGWKNGRCMHALCSNHVSGRWMRFDEFKVGTNNTRYEINTQSIRKFTSMKYKGTFVYVECDTLYGPSTACILYSSGLY